MFSSKKTTVGSVAAAAAGLALAVAAGASAPPPDSTRATVVATVAGANRPLDAAPDPTGRTIFFSTAGPSGPAIFRVPAGGGKVTIVRQGAPLVDPRGLAVSGDGRLLYVADRGAGRILVVPVGAGRVTTLGGSAGFAPGGVDVRGRSVVFAGRDPANGKPGVFTLGPAGGRRPAIVAEGGPLVDPQAVAVASSGATYVSDRGRGGRVLEIARGRVTALAGGIRLGDPAGIALTRAGSKLLVSSLDRAAGTAQVLRIDTRTLATSTFNSVIGQSRAAGGLHRGLRTTIMGWADVSRSGRVYRVDP